MHPVEGLPLINASPAGLKDLTSPKRDPNGAPPPGVAPNPFIIHIYHAPSPRTPLLPTTVAARPIPALPPRQHRSSETQVFVSNYIEMSIRRLPYVNTLDLLRRLRRLPSISSN